MTSALLYGHLISPWSSLSLSPSLSIYLSLISICYKQNNIVRKANNINKRVGEILHHGWRPAAAWLEHLRNPSLFSCLWSSFLFFTPLPSPTKGHQNPKRKEDQRLSSSTHSHLTIDLQYRAQAEHQQSNKPQETHTRKHITTHHRPKPTSLSMEPNTLQQLTHLTRPNNNHEVGSKNRSMTTSSRAPNPPNH